MMLSALVKVFNVILIAELPLLHKQFEHALVVELLLFIQFLILKEVNKPEHWFGFPVCKLATNDRVDAKARHGVRDWL